MTYYIFRYRPEGSVQYLLGVCGGYEEGESSHCGHVWSDRKLYNEATAETDARRIVDWLVAYRKTRTAD